MKATQGTTYRMLGSRLNDVSTQLEELRNIGATGKKLNKPSDDPASIRPVLNTRKQLSNVDRYMETMGKSLDTMQATDGHLETCGKHHAAGQGDHDQRHQRHLE